VMKRVSLKLERSFSFREAFLLAFLLHLLFFAVFMYRPLEFFLPIKIKGSPTPKVKGQTEPIKFTFVDVPEDRAAEARPDTPYFSDKNRLAGGPAAPKPDPSAERKPYLRGNRPDFVFRPGGVQVPAKGSVQPRPPSPRIKEQEKGMKADDLKGTVPLTKGESFDPSKAQPEAKSGLPSSPSLKDTLSDLNRIIETEVFDNRRSSIDTNSAISFDTKDFDFGPYAAVLYRIVKSNWFIPYAARELGLKGVTVIRFRIMKDGRVTGLHLLSPSGIDPFDAAALNSIQLSNPLPALPEEYSKDSVGVTFSFYYNLIPPDK
jgi:TonB family protein